MTAGDYQLLAMLAVTDEVRSRIAAAVTAASSSSEQSEAQK